MVHVIRLAVEPRRCISQRHVIHDVGDVTGQLGRHGVSPSSLLSLVSFGFFGFCQLSLASGSGAMIAS